jgi:hypothetical protein
MVHADELRFDVDKMLRKPGEVKSSDDAALLRDPSAPMNFNFSSNTRAGVL